MKTHSYCAMILITIFCFGSALANSNLAFKHFSDYIDLKPTKKSNPDVCRAHFKGHQKINDRKEDPIYKFNDWKLVMRRGLYKAQVEAAMSEMYRYFLGYSTDVDQVFEQGDYYIARREFKHFDKWDDVIKKQGNQLFIKNYLLKDDGTLISDTSTKKFTGLASVVVLAEFFGDNDAKHYNYGIQENHSELRLIDFDLEDSLNFDWTPDIEQALINEFGEKFISATWYQQEKKNMKMKIAETDFAVIENIIRNHITDSNGEKMIGAETKCNVKRVVNVDKIVNQLRLRHEQLKNEFNRS
jgi:hypothetical protein